MRFVVPFARRSNSILANGRISHNACKAFGSFSSKRERDRDMASADSMAARRNCRRSSGILFSITGLLLFVHDPDAMARAEWQTIEQIPVLRECRQRQSLPRR